MPRKWLGTKDSDINFVACKSLILKRNIMDLAAQKTWFPTFSPGRHEHRNSHSGGLDRTRKSGPARPCQVHRKPPREPVRPVHHCRIDAEDGPRNNAVPSIDM